MANIDEALAWCAAVLGPVEALDDASKTHGGHESSTRRLRTPVGFCYLKVHQTPSHWHNEVHAYEHWAGAFGRHAPRLLAVRDTAPLALVVSEVPGRVMENTPLPYDREHAAWRAAGTALAGLHDLGPGECFGPCRRDGTCVEALPRDAAAYIAGEFEQQTEQAQRAGYVTAGELAVVRAARDLIPAFAGERPIPCHRDYCAANWLVDEEGNWSGVIDFEFAHWDVRVADLSRDPNWNWMHRPDLMDAFFTGYNRALTFAEEQQLLVARVEYALSAILWGHEHAFYGFEREGREALAHLASMKYHHLLHLIDSIVLGGCILAACASAPTATPATSATLTPAQDTPSPTATDGLPTATPPVTGTPLPDATNPPAPTSTPESPATTIAPAEKPAILAFASTAYEVDPGEPFILTWETSGGETRLCTTPLEILECESVPANGSQTRIGGAAGEKMHYTLVAQAGDNEARSELAIATRCLESWHEMWAVAEGSLGACPSTPYTPSAGAIQRFEHGLMIWLATSQEIFVFYDSARSSATYLRIADAWREGMPDQDPDLVPPAGSYQPVRGFGMVWRDETLDGRPLREELGWAIEPESAFETAIQCALTQTKWGRYENCYILGPDRKVYETMIPYGIWTKWPRE